MAKSRKVTDPKLIRNIGIIAHIDAGKTTVSERILYYTGKIHKVGEVHDGTASMDHMKQERERGITITSAATTCKWHSNTINLIDTPGHIDFTAEVERSLRVLDGAVGVFCAVAGVQAQSESVWRQANRYNVPRITFINKMDRVGANFENAIKSMQERLNANVVPIEIPWGEEEEFNGTIDLIKMKAVHYSEKDFGSQLEIQDIPEELMDDAQLARQEMIESLADFDDNIMEKVIEDDPDISEEEIWEGLRIATIELKITPVLCGSALRNKGIQPLLDAIVKILPSPIDLGEIEGNIPDSEDLISFKKIASSPVVALAFKYVVNQHANMSFIRIYSGTLKSGDTLFNPIKKKKEKISRIFQIHANSQERLDEAFAGEIVGIPGLKFTTTGDTLCSENNQIYLESIQFPETVISMAIEPSTVEDQKKLEECLEHLSKEDPTFTSKFDKETGQLIIAGMGELHLEVIKNRLTEDFNVNCRVGQPRVNYRESVIGSNEGEGEFSQLIGESNVFGKVRLKVEPLEDVLENKFESNVSTEVIPQIMQDAIQDAIQSSWLRGSYYSYPMVYVKTTLVGGEHREDEATKLAFSAAATIAFDNAIKDASPILLEPIMNVIINVPVEFLGAIVKDLGTRKAEVKEIIEPSPGNNEISAIAPLSEMFGYSTISRSLTQGRADYTMSPDKFMEVPTEKLKSVVGDF
ncbi:MAG: elongation factor G [Planctomycetota bacterium]|nr:MAG: elongation factor G [Planctomycetota bacterium]